MSAHLVEALRLAREMIATERASFADCNIVTALSPEDDADNYIQIGGALFEQHDADVVADYDRTLAKIDAALAAAEAPTVAQPVPTATDLASADYWRGYAAGVKAPHTEAQPVPLTDGQKSAIQQWLDFGEQMQQGGHQQGYFSRGGWAYDTLRALLPTGGAA